MATTEKDLYAMFGVDPPNEQPEAADPAGQGANEPSVTGTAGRENQATDNRQQATGDGSNGFFDAGSADSRNDRRADVGIGPYGVQNDSGGTGDPDPTGEYGGQGSGRPTGEDAGRQIAGATGEDAGRQIAGATGEDGSEPMSREERARQARLRREREQQAAVDAAVQAALKAEREKSSAELKAMFESAGMVDRYHDNKPITSMEEFRAFQAARQADKLSRDLQGGRLTPESFQAAVDNSPAVREAKEAVERLKARETAETEAARKAEFERRVADELAEIRRMDPSVNTIEDILAKDTGNEFARLVRENNLSFLQAYKLANADGIAEARARAAREGAARNAASKIHLRSVNAGGQVSVDVPPDVIANYRMFDPTVTMEEIRRDYAKRYAK